VSESVLGLVKEAGWLVAIAVLLLSNIGRIADWTERLLSRIWPDLAKSWMAHLEHDSRRDDARRSMDGRAFAELIELYQRELADEKLERKQAQSQMLGLMERHRAQMTELVRQYEKFNSNSIEVLHELSQMTRENRDLLDAIQGKLSGRPSCSDGDTLPTDADAAQGAADTHRVE